MEPAIRAIANRYRGNTAHAQVALAEIPEQVAALHVPLHFAPIRPAVAAADAHAHGMTLADFAPASSIAQEYRRAAEQILGFLERTFARRARMQNDRRAIP